MSRNISLFSGYNQKENRTTNYCLLLAKLVYEESPILFASAISRLLGDGIGALAGVKFKQQQKSGNSVPDGRISQAGFEIFIETKNFDWFYWEQISAHLAGLSLIGSGQKAFIALSNFDEKDESQFAKFSKLAEQEFGTDLIFAAISFDDFLGAFEEIDLPINLKSSLYELRDYLDDQGLISSWKKWFEVVNCVSTMHEIEQGAYLCPAKPGSYWHSRAKFFGPYREKHVKQVHLIEGIVDVHAREAHSKVLWCNTLMSPQELMSTARELANRLRPGDIHEGVRVIVLDKPYGTNFIKDTKGGMLGTKRYFEVPDVDVREVALFLDGKTWTQLRN